MKVTIVKNKNKKFTPIELSVVIESQEEVDDLLSDHDYLDVGGEILSDLAEGTLSLINDVGEKLKLLNK